MRGQTGISVFASFAMVAGVLAAGCQGIQAVDRSALAYKIESAAAARSPMANRPAPDFTLADQNDTDVTLSKLRDRWVVLYFYPEDDTPACTCQANEFTALLTQFIKVNGEVVGVSPDTPAQHRRVIAKYGLSLRLLSDPEHQVMRQYGSFVEQTLGKQSFSRVIRQTMIIDPAGVIRYHYPEVVPRGHAARVLDRLTRLQQPAATQKAN